jgi:hypothetical protein
MIALSIFANELCCFVSYGESKRLIDLDNPRQISEKLLITIDDIVKNSNDTISRVFFSSGPGHFTTIRVVGAVIKGLAVLFPNAEFFGVSTFITLLLLVPDHISSGTIAINVANDNFCCMDFLGCVLCNNRNAKMEELRCMANVYFTEEIKTTNELLLKCYDTFLSNPKFISNNALINHSMTLDYGNTLQYKN